MAKTKEIKLDGSYLEGGGQLVRIALGLAALTGTPITIDKIRGNRRGKGGLKLQHLRAVEFLAAATGAKHEGAEVGGKQLKFMPGKSIDETQSRSLPVEINIGSPGSICLVIQAILPYLIFAGARHLRSGQETLKIRIRGGTNVSSSPSIEYVKHVFLPLLRRIGAPDVSCSIHERGWVGRNSQMGSVTLTVQPIPAGKQSEEWALLERGSIAHVEAYIIMSRRYEDATGQAITSSIMRLVNAETSIHINFEDNPNICYLLLVAVSTNGHRLAADWLYDGNFKRDQANLPIIMAERVTKQLAKQLTHGGCVDEHMRDQLVVYQALSAGNCSIDCGDHESGAIGPSLHAQTAEWVTQEILGVQWKNHRHCDGIGLPGG